MARLAKTTRKASALAPSRGRGTAKLAKASAAPVEKRKPGRPPKVQAAPVVKTPARKMSVRKMSVRKTGTAKAPARKPVAPPAPKVSKDELRAQVEKLEALVASLRTRSREANKAAKADAARISELEVLVAGLEKKAAAAAPVTATKPAKPAKPARMPRRKREIDPGDAVPPGVAVEEPAALDTEAETALENLEEHLGGE